MIMKDDRNGETRASVTHGGRRAVGIVPGMEASGDGDKESVPEKIRDNIWAH